VDFQVDETPNRQKTVVDSVFHIEGPLT